MNAIVNAEPNTSILQLPEETKTLIKASIAENTLKAYQRALQSLTTWLSGQTLTDRLLANYITVLHKTGKSPATIEQVVAAVKWQSSTNHRKPSTSQSHKQPWRVSEEMVGTEDVDKLMG